ncbi:MAG: histidine kinase [Chitinophagaceae bacterium]|nr:histidine kinase [Chitinophagaceae bacterium]
MSSAGKIILVLLWLCCSHVSKGQDTVTLLQRNNWDSVYEMEKFARYHLDASNTEEDRYAVRQPFIQDTDLYKTIRSQYGRKPVTAWVRWIIHNPLPYDEQVLLIFNRMSFMSFYYEDEKGVRFQKDNYAFVASVSKNKRRGFEFSVPAGKTVKVYVRMRNAYQNFAREYPVIIRPGEYKKEMAGLLHIQRYYVYTDVLFLAIIFFITLHTLAQFFFNRRKEFLLYAFYSGCVFAFFIFKFDEYPTNDVFFSYLPYVHKYGNNPLSYLMFYAYYRFVRTFIDFKEIAPWFYRVIIFTERLLLTVLMADIVLAQLNMYPLKGMVFNVVRIYLIGMAFTGIFLLLRTGKPLPRFIAVGSGSFVLGALLAMVLSWLLKGPYIGRFDPIICMQLGMVIELLCFTLGLSYKTGLIEKEKIATQQQLIVQLEENKKLQEELTTKLESRVKEQTAHILEQQKQLEIEKEQQLTLEFTKKITEMELQLLKSQLNPHFYFNTLNNLYGLAMIAPKKAPDAILKLSDIMEYVIYDCRHDKVPVEKELKFINSYIELEKLRYDDNVTIELKVDGAAAGKMISPLLLIQFIENAFKHGLEQYKGNSYLNIHIGIENGSLRYESVNSVNGSHASASGGVGLSNVKKRLEIIYPAKHELHIHSDEREYRVQLTLQLN